MTMFFRSILGLLLLALSARGQTMTLAFDPSPATGVTNYIIYGLSGGTLNDTNLQSAQIKLNLGTNTQITVYSLAPGNWTFAATAQANGIQSAPSNVLPILVPEPPKKMATVFVQYAVTLTNGWTDMGVFRIKLGLP